MEVLIVGIKPGPQKVPIIARRLYLDVHFYKKLKIPTMKIVFISNVLEVYHESAVSRLQNPMNSF